MNETDIKELGELKEAMRNMKQDFRDHLEEHKEKDKVASGNGQFRTTTIIAFLILILEVMNTISNVYGSSVPNQDSKHIGIERMQPGEVRP